MEALLATALGLDVVNCAQARVLCVDDDPNVLAGLERTLFGHFDVSTANSAAAALGSLAANGPPDIVVSDMRMPEMDGARFLSIVRERWPDTMRILLTGYSDTESAIAAINDGAIFRYLCKPCPEEALLSTLHKAAERRSVQQAERRLLETTLAATAKTLADILALSSPWAFRRSSLARSCVSHAMRTLKWPQPWIYEVAASLSQIGSIGVPEETLRRDASHRPLTGADARLIAEHPETAYRLLFDIPRLQTVAEIVRYQARPVPV
ncbi:MAG TPA: response regulator, partial [Rudaea sp.]